MGRAQRVFVYKGVEYKSHEFNKKFCPDMPFKTLMGRIYKGMSLEDVIEKVHPYDRTIKRFMYEGEMRTIKEIYDLIDDDSISLPNFRHIIITKGVDYVISQYGEEREEEIDEFTPGSYKTGSVYKKPKNENFWFIPELMFEPTNHNLDYQGY